MRIYLAGPIAIEVSGTVVLDQRRFRGKQSRLLFAYLVVERRRAVSRQELVDLLWPGEAPPACDVALSALISRLRSTIAGGGLAAQGMTLASGFGLHWLLLSAEAWIDVEAAAEAIDQAEMAVRAGDMGRILGPATVASNISRRLFLPDCDGAWVEFQRGKLSRQLVRALDCHTEMWLAGGDHARAIETAAEAVSIDPFRESAYRLLMRAYVASGNPAKAIRAYHDLQATLNNELGTGPSPETEELYLKALG
ncbi:MAG: hypothetical protein HYY01_07495 [Chloroflexi bacterium]|nr:hypothetical protein [Chloroflexota bacterium]